MGEWMEGWKDGEKRGIFCMCSCHDLSFRGLSENLRSAVGDLRRDAKPNFNPLPRHLGWCGLWFVVCGCKRPFSFPQSTYTVDRLQLVPNNSRGGIKEIKLSNACLK